jgi:chondroitin AC lyase
VWDWRRLPGATIEQDTPLEPKNVKRKGTERFVGGVSDGTYGCATMDLAVGKLTAKKSWFYFDDEFVCLGADIRCATDNAVYTSINQCLLRGRVDGPNDRRWVWHDSIGYIFPQLTGVQLRTDAQTGSWSLINPTATKPVSLGVFSLWLDHGKRVDGASYAYIVMPGATAEQTAKAAEQSPVEILANTADVQAVRHAGLGLTEAIFRRAGSLTSGTTTIAVDRPCALLVKQDDTRVRVAVSNPLNEADTVAVKLGDRELRVELPGGMDAGKSVVQEVPLK